MAINACAKGGQWSRAFDVLEDAKGRLLRPNAITMSSMISGLWESALMLCQKYPVDEIFWNGAISATDWNMAIELLGGMPRGSFSPDSISYNSCISALESWENSLDYLVDMVKHRIQATVISYNSCISCCGAAGRWLQASVLFACLRGRGLRHSVISRSALLTACEKVWPTALKIFEDFSRGRAGG